MAHVVPNILPENLVVQRSVSIYGITQLGLRSHPTGLSTLSFIRSDKHRGVQTLLPYSGSGSTYRFSHHESLSDLSRPSSPFSLMPQPRAGSPTWGFSDCGCMDPFRTRAPHQCTGAQGSNIGPPSLGYSITGPSCFDCYRQCHCCSLHQQTR